MKDQQNQIEKDIYFSREVIKSAQKRSAEKSSGRVSFSPAKSFLRNSNLIEAQDRLQEKKNQALEILKEMIHTTMSIEEERSEARSPQKSDLFRSGWQADDEKSQQILLQETDHWIIILHKLQTLRNRQQAL